MRSGSRAVLFAFLLLVPALVPVTAQSPESPRYTPESLWGVKSDVGLDFVREFLTNYANRSFWEARPTGEGVRVAVIDTGISPEHPDLTDKFACDHCWRDFVDDRRQPYDDNGHGTHVAGIIAADGHLQGNPLNAYFPTGARGLATDAELIVAKAMNASGGGSDERVAEAIEWSVDPDGEPDTGDEPHVLHLSLGVRAPTADDGTVQVGSQTEDAVRDAIEQGVLVVMSAGNQGSQGPAPPGNVDGVLAVGALDADGKLIAFSNRGEGVDVYAPGVVMSAWPRTLDEDGIADSYTGLAGTSQAAPIVTGALALAIDANPALEDGDATMVHHLESIVRGTSQPTQSSEGKIRVLDANALLASQDQGADGVDVGVVTVLSLIGLVLLVSLGRVGWRALEDYVERDAEPQEVDREREGGRSPSDTVEFDRS